MDKEDGRYIDIPTHTHTHTHGGILLSQKKELNFAFCNNVHGPGG